LYLDLTASAMVGDIGNVTDRDLLEG